MRKMNINLFIDDLVQAVKDVGQDLIDNAEDIVGKTDFLSSMTITVRFDPERNMLFPVISVEKEHLCKNAYERYILKGEEQNGKET